MDVMRIMRISMKFFSLAITFPLVAVPLGISYCKKRASSVGNVTTENHVNENEGGLNIVVNPGGDINRKENSTAEDLENPSAEMLI